MSDMTILPTGDGNEAGAAGLGGAVGAVLGSMFTNGFRRDGVGGDGGVAVGANAVLDGISNIQSSVNNLGLQTIQGQNQTNMTVERSAASTFNGITSQNTQNLLASVQGFAGLNTAITASTAATVAAINGADRAALERSFQAQLAAERCCCETKALIQAEGAATRAQALQMFADQQAVLICDMKSQLQESRFALSQAEQDAKFNCKINQIGQLIDFKIPTPPTPPTGCCG